MRNTFIEELVTLATSNPKIVLMVGDLGFNAVEPFAEKFPERFFNVGIAEQNMTGMAAGMASEGFHVFTYSIANFATFRCAEQIRNDVAYHNLPVTVVCVGGGLAYGALGYSHHAVQDYALMRCMPNMLIAAPGDPMETRACMRYLDKHPQPSYLRLGKAGEPNIHDTVPDVEPGKWLLVIKSEGETSSAVLSTGAALEIAAHFSKNQGQSPLDVYSMPLWGMGYRSEFVAQFLKYEDVTTFEDHLLDAGFGSWATECLLDSNASLLSKLKVKALDPVVCGSVGSQSTLNALGRLTDVE